MSRDKPSLYEKNFYSNTNLCKLLNILTTPAASSFFHYVSPENPDKVKFIEYMRIFNNRTRLFDWKPDVNLRGRSTLSENDKEYNKIYNKLLKSRYGNLCSCFWDSKFKYNINPGSTPTPTTDIKPGWCNNITRGSCEKITMDEIRQNSSNPVSIEYYGYKSLKQCSNMTASEPCSDHPEDCILTEAESHACTTTSEPDVCEGNDTECIINKFIKFMSSHDPTSEQANQENSCWYRDCMRLTPEAGQASNYGFTTKNTREFTSTQDGEQCDFTGVKIQSCSAMNIIKRLMVEA